MKDRPPSSYGSVYVPPHRLRSVITCNNHDSATSAVDSKIREAPTPVLNSRIIALPYSQTQPPENLQKGNLYSNSVQYNSAFDDGVSEGGSLIDFELASQLGASSSDYMSEWRQRLIMLLHDNELEELVSREKKDKHNFEQIAALANSMGLYSHIYAKVVVVSKLPLPNYRFDLDDRRPQREVALPYGLVRRVDAYFEEHLTQKSRFKESFPAKAFPRSSSVEEGLFEQPEPLASSKAVMEKILRKRSLQLRDQQHSWQNSSEGKEMLDFRKSLPAYKEKDALLTAISQYQVVIVSGETGCGKTTQIPQFILESEIESLRGAACSVICTQPRRISAISVSERVASERGQKLGESVGYKVRLEGLKGRDTHLLFCTTGILLRRLLVDRNLKGVTHVIVDEIHERGMNEDFLLIVLKDLLPRRPELRLILMSATLDAEIFSSYFVGAQKIHIPGFTFPIQTHFLEDILEMSGYRLTPYNQIDDYGQEKMWKMSKQAPRKRKSQIASVVEDALKAADFKEYSSQTQESLLCWNPDCIGFNLLEHLLVNICEDEIPGAILVFMTGWDDISSLKEKLLAHPLFGDSSRVLLLACHGSMASSEQRLIFDEPQKGIRKIVLATNIAETSITINDVVFVLDCGKAKETSYDALNNTPCLLPSWISKVSAQQRRGRAGRIQPGECYHLYPRCVYEVFADYQLPEILRTPLQSLCLQIKSLNLGSISEFLSRALQSPEPLAVQNAIEYLKTIGALDEEENLTVLGKASIILVPRLFGRFDIWDKQPHYVHLTGRYLTMLPMEPKLGKMLVLGAIFNCLDPILTVVAGLSVRDPFLTPFDKKDLAEAAKYQFSQDNSDHLALVRAFEGWKNAERDFAGYDFCWKNFLSAQSMKAIDSLRKEFFSLLSDTGIVNGHTTNYNGWSHDEYLVRSVICYGLYPGVSSVVHNERSFSLKTMEDGQVLLYSNSVNARDSRIPFPWLVFNEKIKVNSVFLRDSTAVSDSALLLFGGSILKGDNDGHLKMLGGYLEFFMDPSIAQMYRSLREEIDDLIQKKLLTPKMDLQSHQELISAVRLLVSEDRGNGRFVFGRQLLKLSKSSLLTPTPPPPPPPPPPPYLVSRTESGPGGDNSKSQLQTLLTRAGYDTPMYKTKQLKNNQFRASVEFNGIEVMGQPCNNKKSAEKDAAAEALQWLMSGSQDGSGIDRMSMLLKKSKKCRN